jgi:hypothetical protein
MMGQAPSAGLIDLALAARWPALPLLWDRPLEATQKAPVAAWQTNLGETPSRRAALATAVNLL